MFLKKKQKKNFLFFRGIRKEKFQFFNSYMLLSTPHFSPKDGGNEDDDCWDVVPDDVFIPTCPFILPYKAKKKFV